MSSQERILKALRDAREQVKAAEARLKEPIAVVGMGCRLPGGVDTPDKYWQLLSNGIDAMEEVPADRWDIEEYYDPDPEAPGKMYTREGGFVHGIDMFDPQFFRISPREALTLDPQQRLLLEVSWEALEDAGESADAVRGSNTGFFAGLSWHDYERNAYGMDPERLDAYSAMGNTQSIAVGRLAFVLGVHGPTSLVDTACSASLVAVHTGCQSLRNGEADMVLAGGVNLMISPLSTIFCCKIKAVSEDCRCKTFDAAADGYARGEGCGMVVLKRLSDAIADGNHIRAVIRGTAMNHDGPSSGLTVPNRGAQADVIRRALNNGDIDPLDVGYIEAHGTGTSLGDPIEVGALGDVLGRGRSPDRPLRLGSVKTNFGHLEAAAGIAGLMKAVLTIEHGSIPPHLHFNEPSPHIAWDDYPVEVPTRNVPWLPGPRLAGVSSFGFSGTNAHVILGEAPAEAQEPAACPRTRHILCLSARDEIALRAMADHYAQMLVEATALDLADVCYTANTGRARFSERLAVVAADKDDMADQLARYARQDAASSLISGKVRSGRRDRIAFVFTGQGSQWTGMGRGLYESQPVFRQAMDECQELLADELEQPLLDVVFGSKADHPGLLDQTAYTQPALFALEWSLARLWRSWGITPNLVMGHSVGEYVAACVAGVFSLADGLRLIAARGRLMQDLPAGGAMVAVSAEEQRVAAAISGFEDRVSIAAVNGPRNVVVSGDAESVDQALSALRKEGVDTRALTVSHAFHSPSMDPILEPFEALVSEADLSPPTIALVSNVSGKLAGEEVASASYWREHIRQPVRFADGCRALAQAGASVYLEIGPHPVLTGMGQQSVDDPDALWVACMKRDGVDEEEILRCKGRLFARGIEQDWRAFEAGVARRRVRVPTYPFQRKRYWVEARGYGSPEALAGGATRRSLTHPLLGGRLASALLQRGVTLVESGLSLSSPNWLKDHQVFGQYVPPGTMYLEMALAAGRECLGMSSPELSDVMFHQPLALHEVDAATLQCVLEPAGNGQTRFRLLSLASMTDANGDDWIMHASGTISPMAAEAETATPPDPAGTGERMGEPLSTADCYQAFSAQGLDLGPAFQTLRRVWKSGDTAWADIGVDASREREASRYCIHPALLDACGQLVASAFPPAEGELFLPIGVERLTVLQNGISAGRLKAQVRSEGSEEAQIRVADIELFDHEGNLVLRVEGATTRLARREDMLRVMAREQGQARYERQWQSAPVEEGQLEARQWLVFAAAGSGGSELVANLRQAGAVATLVCPGGPLSTPMEGDWAIDPSSAGDYQSMLETCRERHPDLPLGLVYFGNDDFDPEGGPGDAEANDCGNVALLLRALGSEGFGDRARLWLVSRATQRTGERGEQLSLAGAALWGLGAVVSLEHPELRCVRIDLDSSDGSDESAWVQRELQQPGTEDQVAFRGGQRWVARLRPGEESGEKVATDAQPAIRDDARYLITGGFGALGLALAHEIADRGGRHLVLVGRSGASDEAAAAIASLEERGVTVLQRHCDIGDRQAVEKLLAELPEDGLPLDGIFHTAGVLDDGILLQMDASRMARVMHAKVAGGWNLHLASQSLAQPLAQFVSFSSTASLLGSRGQGNYAAANAWLDSLAHYRHQEGLPALTVNWGPWGEVGMAAGMDEVATRRMMDMGWSPLSTRAGMDSLFGLMRSESAQAAVIPLDWSRFLRQFDGAALPAFFSDLDTGVDDAGSVTSDSAIREQIAEAEGEQRRQIVIDYLHGRIAAIVAMDASELSDTTVTFQELGIDSLLHMELRSDVVKELGINIPVADFLDNPTVESLCDLVLKQLALSSLSTADAQEDDDMEEITL